MTEIPAGELAAIHAGKHVTVTKGKDTVSGQLSGIQTQTDFVETLLGARLVEARWVVLTLGRWSLEVRLDPADVVRVEL